LQKLTKEVFANSAVVVLSNPAQGRFTNGDHFWRDR
jgi:hypothetical protein